MRDPEHHAEDAQRIQHAVFGNAEAITDLVACRHHFPPIETRVHLRTTIDISRHGIEIGPVESVEVVDGVELTSDARACIVNAFRRPGRAQPTYPDDVHPYQGPYDLELSVIGAPDHANESGEES